MNREEIRFLADVAARPLSTTVSRYQRLHLSRRKGNAIRQSLLKAKLIESVTIATRSGHVILYHLTDLGRTVASSNGIDPGTRPRASLEHTYWVNQVAHHFDYRGYTLTREHQIKGNGAIDLLAERPGERIAIEVETGKSDVPLNLTNALKGGFDRIVIVATSPSAVTICQKALDGVEGTAELPVELMTWLDVE